MGDDEMVYIELKGLNLTNTVLLLQASTKMLKKIIGINLWSDYEMN